MVARSPLFAASHMPRSTLLGGNAFSSWISAMLRGLFFDAVYALWRFGRRVQVVCLLSRCQGLLPVQP